MGVHSSTESASTNTGTLLPSLTDRAENLKLEMPPWAASLAADRSKARVLRDAGTRLCAVVGCYPSMLGREAPLAPGEERLLEYVVLLEWLIGLRANRLGCTAPGFRAIGGSLDFFLPSLVACFFSGQRDIVENGFRSKGRGSRKHMTAQWVDG